MNAAQRLIWDAMYKRGAIDRGWAVQVLDTKPSRGAHYNMAVATYRPGENKPTDYWRIAYQDGEVLWQYSKRVELTRRTA